MKLERIELQHLLELEIYLMENYIVRVTHLRTNRKERKST